MTASNKLIAFTSVFCTILALAASASAIEVTPESLAATVGLDTTVDLNLEVTNLGPGALEWSILDPSDEPEPDSLIGFNFTLLLHKFRTLRRPKSMTVGI